MNSIARQVNRHKLRISILLLFAVGLYGFLPQLVHFQGSWTALSRADRPQLGMAVAATIETYVAAALLYRTLAFRSLQFRPTFAVQFAAMFANRLLPAGTGAIGVNGLYLRRQRHSLVQAGTVIGANNLIGFTGNMILLGVFLTYGSDLDLHMRRNGNLQYFYLGLTVLAIGLAYVTYRFLPAGRRLLKDILLQITAYRKRPGALARALLLAMALTMGNAGCMFFCAQSIGLRITLTAALVALTAGIAAATVVPTPGGLGAIEAGLYVGLVAGHADAAHALTAVLLFRLVNFWLPLVPGAAALVYVTKRKLL